MSYMHFFVQSAEPAHPFVRPAYDTKADESYDIIRAGLLDAVGRNL
jgi:hypothetical protein